MKENGIDQVCVYKTYNSFIFEMIICLEYCARNANISMTMRVKLIANVKH